MIDRRSLMKSGLLGGGLALTTPRMAFAAADTGRRFIFIIQRGAADGLAILAPTGDPAFGAARGALSETAATGTKLSGLFTLHPQMVASAKLFAAKQASFAHAIASGYRERSHFDAQNILETGAARPYGRDDGWMNRLLGLLSANERRAVAISTAIPVALRGPLEVSSYTPSRLPDADAGLMERVAMLYAEDAQLASLWQRAAQTEAMATNQDPSGGRGGAAAGKLVASLMNGADGARVAMVETSGWDTHVNQEGRLSALLKGSDEMIDAIRVEMGAVWSKTLVIMATEFGRTVHINGTKGTDHGTASAAMLYGGGLARGGTIMADWPGLAAGQLLEGRDLKPTMRFEQLVTDAVSAHYGIDPAMVHRTLFPDFTV
jgi:uncharacterized protein (DUF1501 family)